VLPRVVNCRWRSARVNAGVRLLLNAVAQDIESVDLAFIKAEDFLNALRLALLSNVNA
jgi:hypothetical protein